MSADISNEADLSSPQKWLTIGVQISILAIALLTLVVNLMQIWPKRAKVVVEVISSEELTAFAALPGLTSEFTYKGQSLVDLRKVILWIQNRGNTTIIGKGDRKTIIGKGIEVFFPVGCQLLETKIEWTEFPAQIEKSPPRVFLLKFAQWRKGEGIVMSAYASCPPDFRGILMPLIEERQIMEGELVVQTRPTKQPRTRPGLFARLPRPIATILYFLSCAAMGPAIYLPLREANEIRKLLLTGSARMKKLRDSLSQVLGQFGKVAPEDLRSYIYDPKLIPSEYREKLPKAMMLRLEQEARDGPKLRKLKRTVRLAMISYWVLPIGAIVAWLELTLHVRIF